MNSTRCDEIGLSYPQTAKAERKKYMTQCKNVFEAILRYGHDEDFVPNPDDQFEPTDAPAGSPEKIEVLRKRVELGQPLWHNTDRVDYSGLTGAIRPRE
ncbi:hypothetical protein Pla52nx_001059 [Stieleria varia]|uniref:hypothetical protein n=1 Tax=Stieleria varia TaxID=2528005 RepID=UPI00313E6695